MSCRFKVFVTRSDIDNSALDLLRETCEVYTWNDVSTIPREELLKKVSGMDALFILITEKVDDEFLEAAGNNLKVIGTMSVGYDHIDLPAVKKRNIKVGYTPGVLTDAMAELTMGLILATARRFFEAHEAISNKDWINTFWSPSWMCGAEIRNSIIGIIGLGRIGQAVMKRLIPFKPSKIIYSGPNKKPTEEAEFVSLDILLRESDFVLVTCALNENTRGLMTREKFALMKPSAIFINVSRGAIVDQDALIEALKLKKIKAAGIDVMTPEPLPLEHPLNQTPNLTIVPHIGSATTATRREMAVLTAKNIIAGLQNQPLPQQLL